MSNLADIHRAGGNIGEITFEDRLKFPAMATVITVGNTESAAARPLFPIAGFPLPMTRFLMDFE
jgi:hypothetical protein